MSVAFFLKWVNPLKIDGLTPFPLPVDKFAFLFLILYRVAFDVTDGDRDQAESSEEASADGTVVLLFPDSQYLSLQSLFINFTE